MVRPAFGRYLPRDSWVHRLDPRSKLLAVGMLLGAVFFLNTWVEGLAFAALLAGLARAARLRWTEMGQGLYAVILLMTVSFFLQVIFTPGEPLARLGPLVVSREGFQRGSLLAGRLALLAGLSALLGFSTSSEALAEGLERLLAPLQRLGLPVRRPALALSLSLRFVPMILEEGERILNAQRARGIDFAEGSLPRRARRLLAVFVPLFRACLRRAEELALAMEARGYVLGAPRSRWRARRLRGPDWLALLTAALLSAVWILF